MKKEMYVPYKLQYSHTGI